jgi:mono/diheme cytochrome c family protein
MRYFLVVFVMSVAAVCLVAGKRGDVSRKPPIEIFDDMVRQDKFRPQQPNGFFGNGRTSQPFVPGTVARGSHYADDEVNTGVIPGTTNFVGVIPVEVNATMMARGAQRYDISCRPCHGALGDGNGITKKLGMGVVANLHDARIVQLADGEIFNTITHGKNLMNGYGANINVEDRWAIVAYVRALQRARLATLEDVPEQYRSEMQ